MFSGSSVSRVFSLAARGGSERGARGGVRQAQPIAVKLDVRLSSTGPDARGEDADAYSDE